MTAGSTEAHDVVVVGSGAGALVGALVAATSGLRTVVLEKTDRFGGTTALSGGGVFVPNNHVILAAGVPDTPELAREYIRASVGGRTPESLQDAFLDAGPEAIAWLEAGDHARFAWNPTSGFPDYRADVPGGFAQGRTMGPVPVEDPGALGDVVAAIRPPLARGQGGLPRPHDPSRLTSGQAVIARLLASCVRHGVELRRETPMTDLVVEDGAVVGVEVAAASGPATITARAGVLLAAGGFERNDEMRRQHQRVGADWTVSAPGGTGDAIRAGQRAGAAVDLMDEAWWTPSFAYPDGSTAFVLVERALPGGIVVDGTGRRYANESLPYNDFGHAMLGPDPDRIAHVPSYLVVDQTYLDTYPWFGLRPGEGVPDEWLAAGVVHRADTLEELATAAGLPVAAFVQTVDETNADAARGRDERFGRGESFSDRRLLEVFLAAGGFPTPDRPNPCLAPIERAPFYAARIHPGDIGTKGGLVCDERARVLDDGSRPIPGLYATGNTMASVMGTEYPGPGSTIGPAIVFGYLAGRDCIARAALRSAGTPSTVAT